jgi:hypothetical protein
MTWYEEVWAKSAREYAADRKATTTARSAGISGGTKPLLVIDPGNLPTVATQVRDILAASGTLYNRNGPVRITQPSSDAAPVATPLTTHGVVRLIHDVSRPVKNGEPATLPDRVAGMYLDMDGEWKLPKLTGISATPILSDDGTIRLTEGYDAATGVYCHGVPHITVPERPTRAEAHAALSIIRDAFKTFPFADAARHLDKSLGVEVVDQSNPIGLDESAFLAGLLTAVCRPSLHLAPGLLLNAPSISGAGCGKGLLVRCLAMVAYGTHMRPFTPGNDRHEMDKRLVAEIIEGRPCLFMDNLNSTLLRSNTLASLITERPSGVRILGQSRMAHLEHASFIAVTGNGLSVSEDLARRFLYCELDANCEDPELRPFAPGFLDEISRSRPKLLAAALTIWRWGRADDAHAADAPHGLTLGSFEQWGIWVRDPLLALGCPDPVTRIRVIKERDPERQRVIELFAVWWEKHNDKWLRVSDLAPEVREVADPHGHGRQYLARAVQNLAGTRQGGFLVEREPVTNKRKVGALYRLFNLGGDRPESSASSAPSVPGVENSKNSKDYDRGGGADEGNDPADALFVIRSEHPRGKSADLPGIPASNKGDADGADELGPCAYCGSAVPAPQLVGVPDGTTVPLHRDCERAWLQAHPACLIADLST